MGAMSSREGERAPPSWVYGGSAPVAYRWASTRAWIQHQFGMMALLQAFLPRWRNTRSGRFTSIGPFVFLVEQERFPIQQTTSKRFGVFITVRQRRAHARLVPLSLCTLSFSTFCFSARHVHCSGGSIGPPGPLGRRLLPTSTGAQDMRPRRPRPYILCYCAAATG